MNEKKNKLRSYTVTLTALGPVHIGSGEVIGKKDYYYSPRKNKALILNIDKFLNLIVKYELYDEYEHFILHGGGTHLSDFVDRYPRFADEVKHTTVAYEVEASDCLGKDKSPLAIQAFIRDGANQVYVPGSSLKGALRTVLLTKIIIDSNQQYHFDFGDNGRDKKEDGSKEKVRNRDISKASDLEAKLLHTLPYNKKREDMVNSIMRGFSISDSQSISEENLFLVKKADANTKGNVHNLNLIRECLRPGTEIIFRLTIDADMCPDWDSSYLEEAINSYCRFYHKNYLPHFKPVVLEPFPEEGCIVLGGGSGYFSKNIAYPAMGEEAVESVSNYMRRTFKGHYHELDAGLGISPHILKVGSFEGKFYHMGLCKAAFSEEEWNDQTV